MKRKLKIVSLIVILTVIVLLLSGVVYELLSYKNVEENYPPDGVMVKFEERELHINVKGEKSNLPPVVIEAGTGNWSYDWSQFQDKLSKHTQVITYDRAGYGWSDPPSNGFSLDSTTSDLNQILNYAEIETPIILVGHSNGGVYARHFTDKYPEKVSGLILVDSRNEFFREAAPKFNEKFLDAEDQSTNIILSHLGIIRLVADNTLKGMPDFISKEKYVQVQYDAPFFKVLDEEIEQIPRSVKKLNNLESLEDKPLMIITPKNIDAGAEAFGFSEEQSEKINQKWKESQEKLTSLSKDSELINVENSSHAVMYDQPQNLLNAVLSMGKSLVD
ncbi:alpha/beta fold hydrolase [Aquisalibacillus elongatus]|uniref:Pimeloyl-ACP methyl ester carboxylesterase n=1 Tax=Aquisalibacillus elongatus TaxID=485577 RepID=A0A3N5C0A5_9BACI|nr:alpha/beta hydrolase [Aquisalibacillus elongatus]RPF55488.1 pimeloyl-ACP methyl ester carboxylesterase [Aquisalibacillus elongatus]